MRMMKLLLRKQQLLKYLGKPYTFKTIDMENCIYLDMGDYDIEISAIKDREIKFNIYVWRVKEGFEIVERYMDVEDDFDKVKKLLDEIRGKYEKVEELV